MLGLLASHALDRSQDSDVGAAATEVPAHVLPDLVGRAGVALLYAGDRGHDLAGGAVAALIGVVVQEGLLHRVQAAVRARDPFDSSDPLPLSLHGEREAGQHAPSIDVDGAGAALAVIAALLRAMQADLLTQSIEERCAGVEVEPAARPVHLDLDGDGRRSVHRDQSICLGAAW